MKQIRFNLDNNFRLTLSSANQLFELENNSAELIFMTDVKSDMTYELHCENEASKFYQELEKNEGYLRCVLTDSFLIAGSTKIQLKGVGPNTYIIESNQLSFSVKPFINARGLPRPSQQAEFERLVIEVKEVHKQVDSNTASISGLNTTTSQIKETIGFQRRDIDINRRSINSLYDTTRDTEIRVDKVEEDIDLITKNKADKTYVDIELAKKADKSSIDGKADKTYVDTELSKKTDKTYVDAELNKKADKSSVDGKADKSYVDSELSKKADLSSVPTKTSQLQNDSDFTNKTYVDAGLDKKADISMVNNKADKSYVDSELAKKADKSSVDGKADKSYVDSELTKKQNKLVAGENITIDPVTNTISASGGGEGDVTKEYLEENYYNKTSTDEELNKKLSEIDYNNRRDNYIKDGLVNNSNTLSDAEKLKIESWLGLSETYITAYNETPYAVESDYNPAHKKYVDDQIKEVELYKFPNVTIIGEPTINHGQITDFSAASYLKFPFLVDFRNNAFEINMQFTTGSNVLNQENIFDSDFGLAFAIRQGKFVIAISTNGTSWDLGESVGTYTVQSRTTYYVRLSWNKLQYKLEYSLDNNVFITDIVKTAATQPYPRQIYIGVGENFTEIMNHFSGIVNLNNANLKIGTEIVWQGMDDAGLSTRADVSLSNIDAQGEQKIKDLAGDDTYISIKQYGAVGDGIIDDTNAVLSALADACSSGKNLFIDRGTYLIKDRLKITKSITVFGASVEDSILLFDLTYHDETAYDYDYWEESNAAIIVMNDHVSLKDFTIKGANISTDPKSTSNGIILHWPKQITGRMAYHGSERVGISNVKVYYFKNGLYLYGGWNRYIDRLVTSGCSGDGIKYYPLEKDISAVGYWSGSGDVFIACQSSTNQGAGFNAAGCMETTIWNSVFEYNHPAIKVESCSNIIFKNCWNEANHGKIEIAGNCKFEGGRNISPTEVIHTRLSSSNIVTFEQNKDVYILSGENIVFKQISGVIVKGVNIGADYTNLVPNSGFADEGGALSLKTWANYAGTALDAPTTTFGSVVKGDNGNYFSFKERSGMSTANSVAIKSAKGYYIPVEPGEKYIIHFYARTKNRSAIDGSAKSFITTRTYSEDESSSEFKNTTFNFIADNTWEEFEYEITIPANRTKLMIQFALNQNGQYDVMAPEVYISNGLERSNVVVKHVDDELRFLTTTGDVVTSFKTNDIDSIKTEISTMPKDVQINGASIVSDGVANIPVANRTGQAGVSWFPTWSGITINSTGQAFLEDATASSLSRRNTYNPITCSSIDIGVKSAMCDGKGPDWTAEEQRAAQLRLGILPSEGVGF